MKRIIFSKKIFQYYLPVTLTLFILLTIKRAVVTDGAYDRLYGFPLPYISSNYACTGCGDVYIAATLFDLLIYFIFVLLIFKGIEKSGVKLKTHWIPTSIGLLISLTWVGLFFLFSQDNLFKVTNDIDYKIVHSEVVFDQSP